MALPVPNLDDWRFQDIVDEAKRRIPRYCPEWTDHNLSDPGVALIELFAWMTDQTLYRLNQVPDRLYVKFLELVGIQLQSAAPARTDVRFWLAAPQTESVRMPAGTQVGTVRTELEESVVFMTDEERTVVQPDLVACLTGAAAGRTRDVWEDLRVASFDVAVFEGPVPGDAVYLGFRESLLANILRLDIEVAEVEGAGVDPDWPPWAWEVWTGEDWLGCSVIEDGTRALNVDGSLVLGLPQKHANLSLGPHRAHWLRCRLTEPAHDRRRGEQPTYRESPRIRTVRASSLGVVVPCHNAQPVPSEMIGRSNGKPAQEFTVSKTPVLPRRAGEGRLRVATGDTEEEWIEVESFADSDAGDRHFTWDGSTGIVRFGPRVRASDGSARQYGVVPPEDAQVIMSPYRHGGGTRGNVGANRLTVLKTTIPYVGRVENPEGATGGVDPETLENAKLRGPISLRSGQRAVTARDFERLTLEADANVARARCLPPAQAGLPVRVLVVPRLQRSPEELGFYDLAVPEDMLRTVTSFLDERRTLSTRFSVEEPVYKGVKAVVTVFPEDGILPDAVRSRVLAALFRHVNPLVGGPDGRGWPFGRSLNLGEVFALVSGVEGVVGVEKVLLNEVDLKTEEIRPESVQAVRVPEGGMLVSFKHQVKLP